MADFAQLRTTTPAQVRKSIRDGVWTGSSRGLALGYVQAGLIVVPREHRDDLVEFCRRNPRACPIIEALEPGSFVPERVAPAADLRTDLVSYRIVTPDGSRDVPDLVELWDDSLCAILIGCSYTFEGVLESAGIDVPGLAENVGNPIFRTGRATHAVGPFGGPLVVSMRPFPESVVDRVVELTAPIELGHGAPIHVNDPDALGVVDVMRPEWGRPRAIGAGEVPVFWACSVTASEAARQAGLPWFAMHVPSHTFITDLRVDARRSVGP